MPIRTRISGPPGTGKTTKLISIVEQKIKEGNQADNIVFTTFTRAAAYEARDRTCEKFRLTRDSLPYFRTLHSLCHELTDSTPVMGPGDMCRIGRALSLYFTVSTQETDGQGATRGDMLLRLVTLARANMETIETTFSKRQAHDAFQDISLSELTNFKGYLEEYKTVNGVRDFADMFDELLRRDPPNFDIVIGDEAQDFSRHQWAAFDHISMNAKEVYIAGDDDQCVHTWAGADVDSFVARASGTSFCLSQSYRIPAKVHEQATKIISQIPEAKRVPKTYLPRGAEGLVRFDVSMDDLNLEEGSWFLLGRNKAMLDSFALIAVQQGILFSGPLSVNGLAEYLRAREAWTDLLEGKLITRERAVEMYLHMSQRDRVERGAKKRLSEADISRMFSWDILHDEFGLRNKLAVDEALDMVEPTLKTFVAAIVKRDGKISAPRVEINTIHSSKGREADHVAIALDMTEKTWRSYQINQADEHRVFYVGATRCKKTLTFIKPWTNKHYLLPR